MAALAVLAAVSFLALLALQPDAADLRARAGRFRVAQAAQNGQLRGATIEDLRLVSTSGLTARCAVRRPGDRRPGSGGEAGSAVDGAPGRRYPGYLIAAGYETGRRAVTFPRVSGFLLIACDYPFDIPAEVSGRAFWRALPALRRAVLDSPATLLLALDYLASRPDVDPDAIAVVGASVGVPFATVAAALDRRARAAALLYGGGDLKLLFAHNFDLGSAAANWLAREAIAYLAWPVEPARYAGAISPRPTLAVNAPADPFIPRASALALHRALRQPKEIRWLPLDHFAAFHETDLLAQLTELTADWFRRQGVG